ncbi:NAD(P) transhydrogenase subunit alpha [Halofilum ochraceum]|uniref:NAD(P) transhydrogenase subunit alpha n=1 Tax=Halofilum ochraceum TaxID=1611323 RepID=UPI000831A740|nr:NAD(P) transhydrogenase subunit alpha [Halofilum ochraceum]
MTITVALVKETTPGERRVALDPGAVAKLVKRGVRVIAEKGAGDAARYPDDAYADIEFVDDAATALGACDVLVKVHPPSEAEIDALPEGAVFAGFTEHDRHPEAIARMRDRGITALSFELVPRITRAQSMDALSSQGTITGYKGAVMAAELSGRLFPMLTTAAGTIRPAQVVVIGAGVAGLQAIATARRLGAQVEAYDIRADAREQVESLGAKLIDTGVDATSEGGYARELTDEEKAKQTEVLAKRLERADAVIATAGVPGRPAPKIISADMVANMKNGAVIIDLRAENGGNCELTKPGETVEHGRILIAGPNNVPSLAAVHASEMYGRNLLALLDPVLGEEGVHVDLEDAVFDACALVHAGTVRHEATRQKIEGEG